MAELDPLHDWSLTEQLQFHFARILRDEERLKRWSVPETEVIRTLAGRRVAIVGNAQSLSEGSAGPEIDAHDIVVRINSAPIPSAQSHGQRTDWIAMSVPVDAAVLKERAPLLVLWMTPKRKRLRVSLFRWARVFLNPVAHNADLATELGARPTTGLMVIDLCLRAGANIDLYGFDFFNTKSLSGRRSAAQVPHDFAAERAWVAARIGPFLRLNGVQNEP